MRTKLIDINHMFVGKNLYYANKETCLCYVFQHWKSGNSASFYIAGCLFISDGVLSDIRILLWKEKRIADARIIN